MFTLTMFCILHVLLCKINILDAFEKQRIREKLILNRVAQTLLDGFSYAPQWNGLYNSPKSLYF